MFRIFRQNAGALQLIFVVAVISSAVLLSSSMRPDVAEMRPTPAASRVAVSTVNPVPSNFRPRIKLNGVVETRTETSIIPEVAGRVVKVSPSFRPGSSVKSGEVLFVIDSSDYELAVERTLAEIEGARSELARLEAEAAAEQQIWSRSSPDRPIPDLIARKPQIAAAKARIHSAKAARSSAELALARTTIRAPFDARILDTRLDVGQVVSSNAAVGTMFSKASLEVVVPVSSDELRRIGPIEGRNATIFPEVGPALDGEVVRMAASLDERTRLGTLFVAVENPDVLTLGAFVEIELDGIETDSAFRVPPAALTSRDRLWVVEDNQLAERSVEILGREADLLVVSAFDVADGVVAVPPSDVRVGLPVDSVSGPEYGATGGVAGAAR